MAAEQLIDWLTAGFADDVPARDLDAADRRQHGRATLILIPNQIPEHVFDVERIDAEHPIFNPFVKERLHGGLLPLQRRFAQTGQTGVGCQSHKQIISQPAVHEK